MSKRFTRPVLFAVAVVALAAVASCGTQTLNTDKAESAIKDGIIKQTGVQVASVTCPKEVKIKKGSSFHCSAIGADGTKASVTVMQKDAEGNVSYSAKLVATAKVAAAIKKSVQAQASGGVKSVTCPEVVEIQAGYKYKCDIETGNGPKAVATVSIKDNNGNVTFSVGKK